MARFLKGLQRRAPRSPRRLMCGSCVFCADSNRVTRLRVVPTHPFHRSRAWPHEEDCAAVLDSCKNSASGDQHDSGQLDTPNPAKVSQHSKTRLRPAVDAQRGRNSAAPVFCMCRDFFLDLSFDSNFSFQKQKGYLQIRQSVTVYFKLFICLLITSY